MIETFWGLPVFLAIFGALIGASVLREREVPSEGEIGRGRTRAFGRSQWTAVLLIVLMLLAAVAVALRFQQIAIWE